jgi:bacterial/archaeal transporter family-2 protein
MGRVLPFLYAAAPLVGALITLMNGVNSRLSNRVGYLVAALVIHLVGLAAVSLVLLVRPEEKRPGRLPAYYYLGGFVGVGTVFASSYAFSALGASLAVAIALLGQTIFSITVDATGFLGRKKFPLGLRGLPGVALAIAGVAIMAENWRTDVPAMLAALAGGVLPGLSFILNSELGRAKGIFRSTRVNFIAGLATTLVLVAALRPPLAVALPAIAEAGPVLATGGALMGVAMTASMNFIFPRIPAFSATLLLFSGQALTGVLVDYASAGALDARKLVGTLVLLAGLAINALISNRKKTAPPREP